MTCTKPINTTAKAARLELWRERLEPLDAKVHLNIRMKNKTGAESWNILKSELDSVINRYVPMKKQGKRSKKKHLGNSTKRGTKLK